MTSQAVDSPNDPEIRPLTSDDLVPFFDIRAEAIAQYPQSFGSDEETQDGEVTMTAYRRWLNGNVIGAFAGDRLIGVAGFYVTQDPRSRHRGHLFTVYVKQEMRGKGVGDRLIKRLLALASTHLEQLHLAVVSTAEAAIRAYKRNGFEIYGVDPRAIRIGDTTYDKFLMVKIFKR